MTREEMESSGRLGLILAALKFDSEHQSEVAFEFFVYRRVRGAILDDLRRISGRNKIQKKLCLMSFDEPGIDLIMDQHLNQTPDPFDCGASTYVAASMRRAMNTALSLKEREIIFACFYENRTLAEVGAMLGVTESRVSQLRTAAFKKLKPFVEHLTDVG